MSSRIWVVGGGLLVLLPIVLVGVVATLTPESNQAPMASFWSSCTGLACSFNAESSTDPEGAQLDYSWNFLDGSTGSGPAPQHVYADAWALGAILTVTDDQGASATKWSPVNPSTRSALYASDSFSRTRVEGWGPADRGGFWGAIGEGAVFAVTGGVGTVTLSGPGRGASTHLDSVSSATVDVQLSVALDELPSGGGAYVSLLGRRVKGAGDYRAKVHVLDSGRVGISIQHTSSKGKETPLTRETEIANLTIRPKEGVRLRFQATGKKPTTLRARAWRTSESEPNDWAVTAKDATASMQKPGSIGTQAYVSGSAVRTPIHIQFDDLRAEPVGTDG